MSDSITLILAIGTVAQPLLFGSIFAFMFKYFPTRKEIDHQEATQLARHQENQRRFETIENDVKELLANSRG